MVDLKILRPPPPTIKGSEARGLACRQRQASLSSIIAVDAEGDRELAFGSFNNPGPLCTNRFDAFAELDPAEFPDASNQLELLDRLFPRKTTAGAPKQ